MRSKDSITTCADRLKALADSERLQIIRALQERAQCVSDLAALLDNEMGNISHHLKVLRKKRLVTCERHGKSIVYALAKEVFSKSNGKKNHVDLGCCSLEFET